MNGGVTAAPPPAGKSVLHKPLYELTEDDISQLTREDCRRYLKEKGMRRPSWNKSQAIQQVISLKSLLEPSPPNAKPSFRRPPLNSPTTNTPTVNSNSSSSVKEQSPAEADGSVSALAEDGGQNQLEGPSGSDLMGEGDCYPAIINSQGSPRRIKETSNVKVDQMTIFYSGKLNVYDGVPVDKAHSILHLAASPIHFCPDEPNGGDLINCSPCFLSTSTVNLNVSTSDAPIVQQMPTDIEAQTNRQVSLQRGKFKIKRKGGSSSSGLEMYLSHKMRAPTIESQNSDSNTSNTSQLGAPSTGDEIKERQPKNPGVSIDLNDTV